MHTGTDEEITKRYDLFEFGWVVSSPEQMNPPVKLPDELTENLRTRCCIVLDLAGPSKGMRDQKQSGSLPAQQQRRQIQNETLVIKPEPKHVLFTIFPVVKQAADIDAY